MSPAARLRSHLTPSDEPPILDQVPDQACPEAKSMPKLDRYLLSEFAQAIFATLVVLLIVTVGGAFTDVLQDIARGRVPAGLMLAQLGLVLIKWLPLILPLALMLGLMMGVGRLYRDSEMPVISSIGVGPAAACSGRCCWSSGRWWRSWRPARCGWGRGRSALSKADDQRRQPQPADGRAWSRAPSSASPTAAA